MLYAKRTVSCPATRMTREAARQSLEKQFEEAEVLDLKRIGDRWSATLLEPKQAEFPPSKDEGSDGGPPPFTEDKPEGDDAPDSDSPDGPPSDGDEGDGPPKEKKGEGAELHAVMDLLSAIADKLGIMPGPAAPGADDGMPPMAPPGPMGPPGAGAPPPHGGPNELVHRTKLKPGETPPGGTPIGAPAFASVNDLSRLASFDAFDDTPGKSINQAKKELDALFGPQGFQVRQIKRVEGGRRLAAKLSRR